MATLISLLYTFLPYHFIRGETHLFLATYWVIPLGAYVALRILAGDFFVTPGGSGRRGLVAAAPLLVICVVVATSSAYYGFSTMILALAASGLLAIHRRHLRALLPGLIVAAVLGTTIVVNAAPSFLYVSAHGKSANVAARSPGDTEQYSLKIANLVLPRDNHRIGALASLTARYRATFPLQGEAGYEALGIVATIGLGWLVIVAIGGWVVVKDGALGGQSPVMLASLAMVTLLVATTGGISTLVALLGFSQVRAWNRMSIYVAFFALFSVGFLLDRLAVWPQGPRHGPRRLRPWSSWCRCWSSDSSIRRRATPTCLLQYHRHQGGVEQ